MKKIIATFISLLLLTSLFSCGARTYELAWDGFCYSESGSPIELDIFEKTAIIDILNNGEWYSDIAKCSTDVKFYTKKQSLGYSMDDGIFNDFTLGRSLKLSNQEKITVNGYLRSESGDDRYECFYGKILEAYGTGYLIKITDGSIGSDKIYVHAGDEFPALAAGDYVKVVFDGAVAESYPPQIFSVRKISKTDRLGFPVD